MKNCDSCNECCTVLSIPELDKSLNVACKNLCDSKCKVYENRIDTCKFFNCLWKTSDWPDWLRPDKSGILLTITSQPKQYVTAYIKHRFAINKKIRKLIKHVGNKYPVKIREVY